MGPAAGPFASQSGNTRPDTPLSLADFEPRSMLELPVTRIEQPRYPVIDAHTHLSWGTRPQDGVFLSAERTFLSSPEELIPVMDRCGVQAMVNFTGGYGSGLEDCLSRYDRPHPGRFFTMTEPIYERFSN